LTIGGAVSGADGSQGRRAGTFLGLVGVAGLAWGHFEAGWVRLRELEVCLPRLPEELAGLRIAHLSDFHLGVPSRGRHAVERAVVWVEERGPDLVAVTGDLLARPAAVPVLADLLARLDHPYVVLGNHEVAHTRDPFSRASVFRDAGGAELLVDDARVVELRGKRVQIVGVDPFAYRRGRSRPHRLADPSADLRILLCHYPYVLDRLPRDAFHLVLAGHMHDGQIAIPYGFGKLRLAHPRARYTHGLYEQLGTVMHVSPGLGTTFVPFRFAARPEATELRLVQSD
jgi:predicted MPP superfamily phosphohydrolase